MSINNNEDEDCYLEQRDLPLDKRKEICDACGGWASFYTFEKCCKNCPVRYSESMHANTTIFDCV